MPYKDKEKRLEYSKKYYLRNKEKMKEEATKNYYENHEIRKTQKKEWAEKNKDKLKKYRKQYATKYRQRKQKEQKARWTVHNAIKYGKIKRINKCSSCGEKGLIHAHHEDYDKPLKIEWLCHQCHFARHRKGANNET